MRIPAPSRDGTLLTQEERVGTTGGHVTFPGKMIDMFIKAAQEIQLAGDTTSFIARAGVEAGS